MGDMETATSEPQGFHRIRLTEEQRGAVESDSGEVLCIAPAGSGKTRVLTERVRFLIQEQGASPSDLLVLTFTRRSAGELVARLATTLGEHTARKVWCATFHSACLKILQADGGKLGYLADSITVLDGDDSDMLLRQCAEDLGYVSKKGAKLAPPLSWERLGQFLDSEYTGRVIDEDWAKTPVLGKIVRHYWATLLSYNVLDYGLILKQCKALLQRYPDVLARYQAQIKHVLVDELQDSDAVQYSLHDLFAPPATFFGVGDTRQSIYGFRGARPDYMVERHPKATLFNLRFSFRCGPSIVAAANSLIARNREPLAQPMIAAESTYSREIEVMHGRTNDIVLRVARLFKDGYAPSDIAILARTHRVLRHIEECATEIGLPVYRVGQRFDLCETPDFRTYLAFMRLWINPKDMVAKVRLRRAGIVADYDGDHIPDPTIEQYGLAVDEGAGPGFPPEWVAIKDFWLRNCAGMTLREALQWYALRDTQDDLPAGGAVTLATVHAAKGLEYPVVLVAELQEGTFPSTRALKEKGGEREERRLAYVGMTRAKERLILHWRAPEDQAQDRKLTEPSRFIAESASCAAVVAGSGG